MEAYEIIRKPLLTEKSYVGIQSKVYTFIVDKRANKIEIAKAVETMFGVEVDRVNTINVKGHKKSQNTKAGRTVGKTSDIKKAIVTLKENSKPIAFFDSLS
ncbi:MAG: 50S ribosomal protein L23 [Candidatus Gastranaerophilales bacterium]|nr:50S ribosomal protein L23 [Clostridia bacterium]MBQ8886727.1 50S ribosomal protein L23 [Candidatus Gastranaerophilales bacterium]